MIDKLYGIYVFVEISKNYEAPYSTYLLILYSDES